MPGIIHIVLFQFKPTADRVGIDNVCANMLALKDRCVLPTTGMPYIKRSTGGIDNSPEGKQNGFTHAFVVEFESTQDRDYYIKDDPAHARFVQMLGELIENVQVIDYEPGAF